MAEKIDFQKALNEQQYQAVTQGDGYCLVISGPGSGKTRTLVFRAAYLLAKGISPENILLVTFTKKAAREMLNRVQLILGRQPEGLLGGTFHHICNLYLRKYAQFIGYKNDFGIMDEDDSKNLIASVMEEMEIAKGNYPDFPRPAVVQEIVSLMRNTQTPAIKAIELNFSHLDIADMEAQLIDQIAEAYQVKKQAQNVMDYDDLLANWLKVLNDFPEIRNKVADRFHYVLVDEYQDTNVLQERIVELMSSVHKNLMAVGDDAQSIYSFRGANIENILNFSKKYPQAKTYKIETNYRSTPQILDLANESIKNNYGQIKKTLQAVKNLGRQPVAVWLESASKEAEFVAQAIANAQRQKESLNEIAVLFRSKHHASELELALAKRNVPYIVRGGMKFFEQAHIKDTLSFLRALANTQDQMAWQRILKMHDGVGNVASQKIFEVVMSAPDMQKFLDDSFLLRVAGSCSAKTREEVMHFFKFIKEAVIIFNGKQEEYIAKMIFCFLDNFYATHLKVNYPDAKERIEDVHELAKLSNSYNTVSDMLASLSLSEEFESNDLLGDEPRQAVTLSTIHQAKGLEWKIVFLICLREHDFPNAKSMENPDALEEERRIFYVAVTRSKEQLYLTYPVMDWKRKGDSAGRPSIFLREIKNSVQEMNMAKNVSAYHGGDGYDDEYSAPASWTVEEPPKNYGPGNRLGDFGGKLGQNFGKKKPADDEYELVDY